MIMIMVMTMMMTMTMMMMMMMMTAMMRIMRSVTFISILFIYKKRLHSFTSHLY